MHGTEQKGKVERWIVAWYVCSLQRRCAALASSRRGRGQFGGGPKIIRSNRKAARLQGCKAASDLSLQPPSIVCFFARCLGVFHQISST